MIKTATTALEKLINSYLKLDPESSVHLTKMQGKILQLKISDWNLQFYFLIGPHGLQILNHYEGTADTSLKAKSWDFLRLLKKAATDFSALTIEGDIELGRQFRDFLHSIDIDWEEHLSKFTGDVIAHRVGSFARNLQQWGKNAAASMQQNITEYLQEEKHLLVTKAEMEDFINEVTHLRQDVERLEAKLKYQR